jgi:hypothetical protein
MADINRTQFALRLPADLIEDVDKRAEALHISRNQWYENMTRWVLANTYIEDKDVGVRIQRAEAG